MNRYIQLKMFSVVAIVFNIATIIILIKSFSLSLFWIISFILIIYSCVFVIISSIIKLFGLPNEKRNSIYFINQFNQETVDIFLPIAGESIDILSKTWKAVYNAKNIAEEKGLVVKVYVLNDNPKAYTKVKKYKTLLKKYNYIEITRDTNAFKKAGNIKNAYKQTDGDYIIIFDADFCPIPQFIVYTISKMLDFKNKGQKIGIYQTPQAFKYDNLSGLEKGACNIQGFFYDIVQVSRNTFQAAICVGSNAVYNRQALKETDGNYLIEHSEDVWTGFSLTRKGWNVYYESTPLAYGMSPDHLYSYYKQQTRWCLGSLSLIKSKFFWETKLSIMQRISYLSGFMFYVYCIILLLLPILSLFPRDIAPQIVNIILWIQIAFSMYIIPNLIYKKSDINTMVAHLFATWSYTIAIIQNIFGQVEKWEATGISNKPNNANAWYKTMIILIHIYTIIITALLTYNLYSSPITPLTFYLGLNFVMHWVGIIYYHITDNK